MQAERKRSFYRALILGALLIPINLYWLMHAESLHPAVYSTLFTLFYNVTFSIFVLVLLNALLKKTAPQIAFQPSELLIVYVMLSIGTGIFGHDLMIVMVPTLTSLWGATPENEWAVLFGRHIPQWLTVYDERALIAFQKGETTLYTDRNLSAWLLPVAFWSGFLVVLLFVLLCMNAIIRKQWTENEKLSYPVIQLPLETGEGRHRIVVKSGSVGRVYHHRRNRYYQRLARSFSCFSQFQNCLRPCVAVHGKAVECYWLDTGGSVPFRDRVGLLSTGESLVFGVVFPSILEGGTHLSASDWCLGHARTVSELSDIGRVDGTYNSRIVGVPQIPQAGTGLGNSR